MPPRKGRRPNDPAGQKGVASLEPGQRRRYGNVIVYRKTTAQGGYTVSFPDGAIAWYKYAEDATAATIAILPVQPDRKPDKFVIGGRTYDQPIANLIRRPN